MRLAAYAKEPPQGGDADCGPMPDGIASADSLRLTLAACTQQRRPVAAEIECERPSTASTAKGVARMSDNLMSRRKFLVSAGTVAAAAGIAGVGLAKIGRPAAAAAAHARGRIRPTAAKQPIPETLARRAYELYYLQGGCAEATWWPIIEALAAANPTTWGTLPKKIFAYGGGGVGGLGHAVRHLQRLRAPSSAWSSPTAPTATRSSTRSCQYYAETPLPTNGIDKAVARRLDSGRPARRLPCRTFRPRPPIPSSATPRCPVDDDDRPADGSTAAEGPLRQGLLRHDAQDRHAAQRVLREQRDPLPGGRPRPEHRGRARPPATPVAKGKMACDSCHDETGAGPHDD